MIGIIIGGIIYLIIGFLYGILMLFLIVSEDENDLDNEIDTGGAKIVLLVICTVFWIILIPLTIIYRLYNKIKGGN